MANMTAWMFDMLPQTFDPITVAVFVGGFMAIIAYFNPRVGLLVSDLFFPPPKAERTASSTTVLTSLQKRQVKIDELKNWNDLNLWSIKRPPSPADKETTRSGRRFRERQEKTNKAVQDLIGQNSQVIQTITQRLRTCAKAKNSSGGDFDPLAAEILSCCGWIESKQTDPIQLLVVFVGAVWNPASRNIVLDLNAVRKQFINDPGIAFVYAPIPSGNFSACPCGRRGDSAFNFVSLSLIHSYPPL